MGAMLLAAQRVEESPSDADHTEPVNPDGDAQQPRHVAFQAQCTPKLRDRALRVARRRAALVRRAGRRVDRLYEHELAQDAIADTWMGTVSWDPERDTLLEHVRDLIHTRTSKDAASARQAPHIPLTTDGDSPNLREVELALSRSTASPTTLPNALPAAAALVLAELRPLAEGDPEAIAVLDAWADGDVDRDDIVARTGLSDKAYKAARARLIYLGRSLPASVREVVQAALRSVD